MKKLWRLLKYIIISLAILIGALVLVPIFFRDQLVEKIRQEINRNLTVTVDFEDYGISAFRHFPQLELSIYNMTLTGTHDFEGDTLAGIRKLGIDLDIMSLFREPVKIRSVQLEGVDLNLKVLPNGTANWYIFPDEPQTDTTSLSYQLNKIEFRDAKLTYSDFESNIFSSLQNGQLSLVNNEKNDFWFTRANLEKWSLDYDGMHLLQEAKAGLNAEINPDLDSFKITLGENTIFLNEMEFELGGFAAMPDTTIEMDLNWKSKTGEFKQLLSLIPLIYRTDFDRLDASGSCLFGGRVKGNYNAVEFPDTDLSLKVENGRFQYPDLPGTTRNIRLELYVENKDGDPDRTTINLATLHVDFDETPIDAKMLIKTPVSDPQLDGFVKGAMELSKLKNYIPMNTTDLSGLIDADLYMKGKLSAIQNKEYEKFDAKGTLVATKVIYRDKGLSKPFEISNARFLLSPAYIEITALQAKYGLSDINLSGKLEQYLAYLFRDEPVRGDFKLKSTFLDINSLLDDQEKPKTGPSNEEANTMPSIEIPKNLNISIALDIGKLLYDNLELEQVQGKITLIDGTAILDQVSTNMLDGNVQINGKYGTPGNIGLKEGKTVKPAIDLKLALHELNFARTFETFNTVQKLAPIGKNCKGAFSLNMDLTGDILNGISPDLNTLMGMLRFKTNRLQVEQSGFFKQLSTMIKSDLLDSPTLSKVDAILTFQNGRITVNPFDLKMGNALVRVGGQQGMAGDLNYQMDFVVPSSDLGSRATDFANELAGEAGKYGVNLKVPEKISFAAFVEGSLKSPEIRIDASGMVQDTRDELIKQVKDKVDEQIDKAKAEAIRKAEEQAAALLAIADEKGKQLIAEAQKKADQVKNAADANIDKLKKEADRQADELVQKAGNNPVKKIAAEEAAKRIRKEAAENADKLKKEAARQTDGLVQSARNESELLQDKARKEGEKLIDQAKKG